jgi:hypothetical protein
MSRTGIEPKPAWLTLPEQIRMATGEALGAPVVRAARVWGGYSPTPTYRLLLANGRKAFFKAVGPADNEFARAAHAREERVYRELADLIAPWAPELLGSFENGPWRVILLEDLGPKSAPPWSPGLAGQVSRSLGDFHVATLGVSLPDWLPRPDQHLLTDARLWRWADDPQALQNVASLAGAESADAMRWLREAAPSLVSASNSLRDAGGPVALAHRDVRSDNLRWVGGRLRLFDWPHVGVGPAEDDAAMFAQSVTAEGGPDPDTVMEWYGERAPLRPKILVGALASIAGFFADQAWRPEAPGLPRLRAFQRRQLWVTLNWASQRLHLPEPEWLDAVISYAPPRT